MPEVKVIGIHPLDYSDELFDEAVTRDHGLIALNPNRTAREFADYATRRNLRSIVLVEMLIRGRDRTMYIGDFGQSSTGDLIGPDDPVAYEEVYLSPDGEHRIANYLDQVPGNDVRVAFYLHGYRPDRPILTSYGAAEAPPLTAMPSRLRRLAPYRLPRGN
ncbi:MAG: hypothetical protein KF841_13960 [Phycisphaerae bacterium]|nr:hypothetical protein [Phycisphaerae bacterium]